MDFDLLLKQNQAASVPPTTTIPTTDPMTTGKEEEEEEGEEEDVEDELASLIPTCFSIPSNLASGRPTLESSELILLAVIFDSIESADPLTETLVSMRMLATLRTFISVILSILTSSNLTSATFAMTCLNLV